MTSKELQDTLGDFRIVPVIALDDSASAIPLGEALLDGGLPVAEITFRTDAAAESIRLLSRELPDLLLGAGTVLSVDQLNAAVDAGADFVVTPGFNPRIVDHALDIGMPIVPGVNNPTGVEQGLDRGLELLKFFPAAPSGGVEMLKALRGPYKSVNFVPTGGVNGSNLESYLSLPNVTAVGGSWLVPKAAIEAGDFGQIRDLVGEAGEKVSRIQ